MDVTDRTVLITGATDGVGRLVAERLGAAGAHVLVHGRNGGRAESLAAAITRAGGKASVHLADLASLDAVRGLADEVARDHGDIDILINNAGVGFGEPGGQRELSRDGHELRFAVNYLACFLLTRLLLPRVTAVGGRIVNVASAGQQPIDFADVMMTRAYDGTGAYRRSKLAQIMFTFDLAEELKDTGITVNALHPATFMATTMVLQSGVRPTSSVEEGADAILNLAVSPDLEGRTGLYFNGLAPARANPQAYDADARARLRALSYDLTGLAPPARPEF